MMQSSMGFNELLSALRSCFSPTGSHRNLDSELDLPQEAFHPLHELLRSLGKRKSRVILKTRVLSVCDVTRKIKLALKFLL